MSSCRSSIGRSLKAFLRVGKWRCKELFTPPRKTCNLSHARQSSVASMEYAIIRINDIPSADSEFYARFASYLADGTIKCL